MKKIYILFLSIILVVVQACDPLADEIEVIDEESRIPSADVIYTLTEDDYETADDECDCAGFGNFSSDEDVRSAIPIVLTDVFPALGDGSSALVTYEFFNGSSPDLRGNESDYTVTDAEYEALGFGFGNFSDLDEDIPVYANFKEPNAEDGDFMNITHEFFSNGSTTTETTRAVYTVAYGWMYAEPLPEDSYADFFNESPPDFSFSDEGEEKIPAWLKVNRVFAAEGDRALILYLYDTGPDTAEDVALFIFDGTNWILYQDGFQNVNQSLAFGHNGTTWVPDNTIKYTLTSADFGIIGDDDNGLGNADARANMRQFGNFNTFDWSNSEIIEAIGFVLKSNFPDNEVGQKYIVTYSTFPGGDLEARLILDESGEYVVQEP